MSCQSFSAVACDPVLQARGTWDLLCFPRNPRTFQLKESEEEPQGNCSRSIWDKQNKRWTFPQSNSQWQVWSLGRRYSIKEAHVHIPAEQTKMDGELHLCLDDSKYTMTLSIPLIVSCSVENRYEVGLLQGPDNTGIWDWTRLGSTFKEGFLYWSSDTHQNMYARAPLWISPLNMEKLRLRSQPPRPSNNVPGLPLVVSITRDINHPVS